MLCIGLWLVWGMGMVVDNAMVLSTVNEVILYLPGRELVEQYAE